MTSKRKDRPISIWLITIIAIAFGLLTIKAGGSVLFIDGAAREEAGNYVPFVLWFNFLAGFAYLVAGAGLFMQKRWGVWASLSIAVATIVVFVLFGLHILNDGSYEFRTVMAMSLRTSLWLIITAVAYRRIIHHGPEKYQI
jgi:hypothetical protein